MNHIYRRKYINALACYFAKFRFSFYFFLIIISFTSLHPVLSQNDTLKVSELMTMPLEERLKVNVLVPAAITQLLKGKGYIFGKGYIYMKINHTVSNKSRLYLSFFYGYDRYKKEDEIDEFPTNIESFSKISWKNYALGLRWNYLIHNRCFLNTTITFSGYKYKDIQQETKTTKDGVTFTQRDIMSIDYHSGIKDMGFKTDFDLHVSRKHFIRFGTEASLRIYQPFVEGRLIMKQGETSNPFAIPTFYISYDTLWENENIESYTVSAYIEDEITLNNKIKTNIGFRYNVYYSDDSWYYSYEPRFSFRYMPLSDISLKAGYARMSQNTHLLSNSFLVLPFDVWIPSSSKVKPLFSDHYTIGSNALVWQNLDVSMEGFYIVMQNDIIYKQDPIGANQSPTWEDYIEQGMRRLYGLEAMIRKQRGNYTGWITYTLSKAERKFESINEGDYFSFCLVRRHRFSVSMNKRFSENINAGIVWQYSSGVKATSEYCELSPVVYQGGTVTGIPGYSPSDTWSLSSKIPAYHRMDISANFIKKKRKGQRIISLGVYNVYASNNPFLISESDGYLYLSRIQMVIPFVQHKFRFE